MSQHFRPQKARLSTVSSLVFQGDVCIRLTTLPNCRGLRSVHAANGRKCLVQLQKDKIFLLLKLKGGNAFVLQPLNVHTCFLHAGLCVHAYLFTRGSWLFGCCRAQPQSNWADIRLWLILLMSAASRGEGTERRNCQTNIQVTSFIPPPLLASAPPVCTHRKEFSDPPVPCWLHHCVLRLLTLLHVCCRSQNLSEKKNVLVAKLICKYVACKEKVVGLCHEKKQTMISWITLPSISDPGSRHKVSSHGA